MILREEVEKLAELARLTLQGDEVEALQKDISNILEYVGQVSAISGGAGEPVVPLHHNILRDDTLRVEGDMLAGKDAALRAAFPRQEDGYNVVRKILQRDE